MSVPSRSRNRDASSTVCQWELDVPERAMTGLFNLQFHPLCQRPHCNHASTKTKTPNSIHARLRQIPAYMGPCRSPTSGACRPEPHRPLYSIVSRFRDGYIKPDADKAPQSSSPSHTTGISSDSPSPHRKPPQPPRANKRNGKITGLVKVMGRSENMKEQGARLNDEIGKPRMVKSEGETPRTRGGKRKRNNKKAAATKTNAS